MKHKSLTCLSLLLLVSGCETLQTPQQRRQAELRQQASTRMTEEQVLRMQSRVESMDQEYARLMQEIQQLRSEIRSYNSQLTQLNSSMKSLESKQAREMQELVQRVQKIVGQVVSSGSGSGTPANRGAGYEHEVQSGHTLSTIAQAYNTTVAAIKKANNLQSDTIYVGQKLFIPQ